MKPCCRLALRSLVMGRYRINTQTNWGLCLRHRNMILAGLFLRSLIRIYGRRVVYSDGGTCVSWSMHILRTRAQITFTIWKEYIVERTIQYMQDRTESFDDYYQYEISSMHSSRCIQMAKSSSLCTIKLSSSEPNLIIWGGGCLFYKYLQECLS